MRTLSDRILSLRREILHHSRFWWPQGLVTPHPDALLCGKMWKKALLSQKLTWIKGDLLPGNPDPFPEELYEESLPGAPKLWNEEIRWENLAGLIFPGGIHLLPDYSAVLREGFPARAARCRALAEQERDPGKKRFYLAMQEISEAILLYLERLEAFAAAQEDGEIPARLLGELRKGPPDSFHGALLAYWIVFLITRDSPGLPDRVLEPYLQADLARGAITEDAAFELTANFFCKIHFMAGDEHAFGGSNHMSVAGTDANGENAAGLMTELCLDAAEALGLIRPQIAFRWSAKTPRRLLKRALQVLAAGNGSPDFSNDETFIPALMKLGIPRCEAADYSPSGCNEVTIPGNACMRSLSGHFNVLAPLLAVLGVMKLPDPDYAPPEIPPESFEALYREWERALGSLCGEVRRISEYKSRFEAENNKHLYFSLFSESSLKRGWPLFNGGAQYNACNWSCQGLVNLADSFTVIRKAVYEDHTLTLAELAGHLKNNWKNAENLRLKLRHEIPSFGNGDPAADRMLKRVCLSVSEILNAKEPLCGGRYTIGSLGGYENAHVIFGERTPASPDGRFGGEAFPSGFSPAAGRDVSGLTAALISAASAPGEIFSSSAIANITLSPELFAGKALDKTTALVESYFRMGGIQLQPSVVDAETLRKARKEPEKYRSLIVRVAGYSARFTALPENVQDEVISRTVNR